MSQEVVRSGGAVYRAAVHSLFCRGLHSHQCSFGFIPPPFCFLHPMWILPRRGGGGGAGGMNPSVGKQEH